MSSSSSSSKQYYLSCWFQELQEKQQGQVAPADPLDVDNQQISDNLSNASKQPSTPYGAIPNGTAPGEGMASWILCQMALVSPRGYIKQKLQA